MATPMYRIIDEKGAYMARDPTPVLLALGDNLASAQVYGIRAAACELLPMGTEVAYDGEPGPHLQPLNAEAERAMAAYWDRFPNATLDPTRKMPLGQDPMGGRSIEQLVGALLDGMDRDASVKAAARPAQGEDTAALLKSLAEGQAQLGVALAAVLAAQTPAGKGRAA